MDRSYEAGSIVQLPALTANTAATLVQEMVTAANAEKKLPPVIAADRDELAAVYVTLDEALKARLAPEERESPVVRAADLVIDNAWSAVQDFTSAWSKLPEEVFADAAEMAALRATIFKNGLAFTKIDYKEEWRASETRIGVLESKGYDKLIRKLGGGVFLDHLYAAHKTYGEVLGITAVKEEPAPVDTAAVGDAFEAAQEVLRVYVLHVSALVRRSDPAGSELAARLLAPLRRWKSRPPKKEEAAPKKEEPAPKKEEPTPTP